MKQPIKFKLADETVKVDDRTLYRIVATEDIPYQNVKKGDKGGFVEKTHLDDGTAVIGDDAWVYDNACVYDKASVSCDARVLDNASVYGNAKVFGNAWVYDNAQVSGNAIVYGNVCVSGSARISSNAQVFGNAIVYGNVCVSGSARISSNAQVFGNAWVYGNASVCGNAWVLDNARVSAKSKFSKGHFIGGDDSGKITDITEKTGSSDLKNQYVLGDYKIEPIEEETEKEKRHIEINGKSYEISDELAGVLTKVLEEK